MSYRRTEAMERRLAAKRGGILAAAEAAGEEGGMAAVQIAPVAQRAGIAAGTVYRYFPAKADLVAALIAAAGEREVAAMRAAANGSPGALSALAAAIGCYASRLAARRRLAWAMIGEPADPDIEDARRTYRATVLAELTARITAAIETGRLPAQDADVSGSASLGSLIEGVLGPLAPEIDPASSGWETIQNLTLFVLRGLGVPDAPARGLVVQMAQHAVEPAEHN